MYSFEGDFRRRPQQNHAGASKQDGRSALLQRVHQERQRREDCRRRHSCALIIQAYVRSFLERQRTKKEQRKNFDYLVNGVSSLNQENLDVLMKCLVFFYDKQQDLNRLILVSQHLIKSPAAAIQGACTCSLSAYRLRKVLSFCMGQLLGVNGGVQALPLRMLEIFTDKTAMGYAHAEKVLMDIFKYLIKEGFFLALRRLLEVRAPPLQEASPIPPTPHCAAVLNFITRPLALVTAEHSEINEIVFSHLCKQLLAVEYTEPIKLFLVPALAVFPGFPFSQFVCNLQRDWTIPRSSWMLHSFLSVEPTEFSLSTSPEILASYIECLAGLSENLSRKNLVKWNNTGAVDNDSDSDDDNNCDSKSSTDELEVIAHCCSMLNESQRVQKLLDAMETPHDIQTRSGDLQALCRVCHHLLVSHKLAVHKYKLLYTLAFKPSFLRKVWDHATTIRQSASWSGPRSPLLQLLARGVALTSLDSSQIIPSLAVFCALFSLLISTLHDGEFCSDAIPFTLTELIPLITMLKDVCLGLVELAFPDSRPIIPQDYHLAVGGQTSFSGQETSTWAHLFKVSVHLLQQLHTRDLRREFCPEGHWISNNVQMPLEKPDVQFRRGRHGYRPFRGIRTLTREELEDGPPLSIKEIRSITILQEMPFVVPFASRVLVLQGLLQVERVKQHGDLQGFLRGPSINITLRRSHLYEDAFDKLSPDNEPNMRLKMRVQLINSAGLEEAGVDGGGMFREVLSELLQSAFNPNRGFFRIAQDQSLYPNPGVAYLIDDFQRHYYFIGRILGKALFENLLVELPLSEFFLCKLVGPGIVDAHQLASLDPTLHRTLLSLKSYAGDVSDLGLDFTVMSEEVGETRVEELKPGGANITVTSSNLIEYIHLMADHKLNRQIQAQCQAFRQGLDNVVPLHWLHMFSYKELQILISGSEMPVDVEDMKTNTNYTGGYTSDHPVIQMFWRVVEKFDDDQKRQLLKFVTSCSRPPLLGFKELEPPFCIQLAGSCDRLPTASTCINLLKLPEFEDENILHDKLLYAIQSGAGFELS